MADQTKAPTKGQDAEKAQERKRRSEPAPEYTGALAAEAIPFAGLLGDSAMELPVERHTALLGDPRFSHPANAVQKARLLSELQRRYGNNYVQEVVTAAQTKLKVGQPGDFQHRQVDRGIDLPVPGIAKGTQVESEESAQTQPPCSMQRNEEEEGGVTIKSNAPIQVTSPEWGQTRQLSAPVQSKVEWGSKAKKPDMAGFESKWSAAPSDTGKGLSWAASEIGRTIVKPQPTPCGPSENVAGAEDSDTIPTTIVSPVVTSLDSLWASEGQGTLGVAPYPVNSRAPSFSAIPYFSFSPKTMKIKWFALPILTQAAYEGDSGPLYVGAGLHDSKTNESGAPVYYNMSRSLANRNRDAEQEHANDYKYAYKISLKEAENVLKKSVVGKKFGPKPTPVEVMALVGDTITKKLTHPQLGNDQTKWKAKYETLVTKTLYRDTQGWHTFHVGNRKETKDNTGKITKVTYDIQKGTTNINKVKSKNVIKY